MPPRNDSSMFNHYYMKSVPKFRITEHLALAMKVKDVDDLTDNWKTNIYC